MQIKENRKSIINGKGIKVGIVRAFFNSQITEQLLKSALEKLAESKISKKDIKIIEVPGSMEIPYALQKLAETKKYDCLIALGCVIRGETPHFDYVCKTAQEGVLRVSLDYQIPIGFGVLTVNNIQQAKVRKNLGAGAAAAALELTQL